MAEEVAGVKPKKQRTLQLGASTAPLGYHYEGEKCSMLNGKPTLKLRRDKEGPREDKYGDLYARHEEIKEGKLSVTFHCCIEGFNNKSIYFFKTFTITGCPKPVVHMFVTPASQVVFQNFQKHLLAHHADFLFQCDRPLQIVSNQTSLQQFFPTTPSRLGGAADILVEEEEDEDDVRERQEIETVAWTAFFYDD